MSVTSTQYYHLRPCFFLRSKGKECEVYNFKTSQWQKAKTLADKTFAERIQRDGSSCTKEWTIKTIQKQTAPLKSNL